MVRAVGGFFVVREPGGAEFFCRARGRIRQKGSLIVGDRVLFSPETGGGGTEEGIIEDVLPRSTCLYRPPVANIDQLILVTAVSDPSPDWQLVSRLLLLAEHEGLEPALYINKMDLADSGTLKEIKRQLKRFPYTYRFSCAKTGKGIRQLAAQLKERCSVFAGPSGAGKSSLLNAVQPGFSLKTGDISKKGKRGRHTTRLVELLPLPAGGTVLDTPGFSRLDLPPVEPGQLGRFFPEFVPYSHRCAFRNCIHAGEPDCAVSKAVEFEEINAARYRHYRLFLEELTARGGHY